MNTGFDPRAIGCDFYPRSKNYIDDEYPTSIKVIYSNILHVY